MACPNRSLILEDVAATLATISVAGGYKTDVAVVERLAKDFDSVRVDASMPWLGIVVGQQVDVHHPSNSIRAELTIQIIGHVTAAAPAAVSNALGDLEDDIIAALNVDYKRGGSATNTLVQNTQTNEADPDAVDSTGMLTGSLVCTVMVVYHRTTGGT